MQPNLWLYVNNREQSASAASLVVFGAEVFYKAKLVQELDFLNKIRLQLDRHNSDQPPSPQQQINEFAFEYLVDCVRILVFFENYMKAELITMNFCVHTLKKEHPKFIDLAKEQFKRPIDLKEIQNLEPFTVSETEQIITHPAIKETTIGINVLLGSKAYLHHYQFSEKIIACIKEINLYRNKLHFHNNIEFRLSEEFIDNIQTLVNFVKNTMKRIG